MNLPPVIPRYIDASNAHDVRAIVDCFADDAVVRDENATRHGKIDIRRWATETIEKYKFQFKPLSADERGAETILSVGRIRIISRQSGHARVSVHYHER